MPDPTPRPAESCAHLEALNLSPLAWARTCRAGDSYSYAARSMAPVLEGELETLMEVCAERGLELFGGANGLHVERAHG
jgi:hypothetical protein